MTESRPIARPSNPPAIDIAGRLRCRASRYREPGSIIADAMVKREKTIRLAVPPTVGMGQVRYVQAGTTQRQLDRHSA